MQRLVLKRDNRQVRTNKVTTRNNHCWVTMGKFDIFLSLLLPGLILFHLFVAPYTKVEESFNLQATHDILFSGIPRHNVSQFLKDNYDHVEFTGVVPRTFTGAVVLAGISQPFIYLTNGKHGQLIVRAVLGMFNAFALLKYRDRVGKALGRTTARWFILLLAGQFHVLFYASRTLPNMFAFGLTTLALSSWLPVPGATPDKTLQRHKLGVYYFVLAGVVFRSELALMLVTHLLYMLLAGTTPLSIMNLIPTGLKAAILSLLVSVPIDSFFWQEPMWPELNAFIFNAVNGKSAEWGTSPYHAYFTNHLPKLLLNPMIPLVGIPLALLLANSRKIAANLLFPNLLFIAVYSLLPHKETRFIIYVVPPLTTVAAVAASYVTTHRRSWGYGLLYLLFASSILLSMTASTGMLVISSLNYPGGEALHTLYRHLQLNPQNRAIKVHLDVPSCMTGVTRFQQDHPDPPLYSALAFNLLPRATGYSVPQIESPPLSIIYDKTETERALADPRFWSQFDYVLTASPNDAMGKWEILYTLQGYTGIEFLRPGQQTNTMSPVRLLPNAKLAEIEFAKNVERMMNLKEDDERLEDVRELLEKWEKNIKDVGFYGAIREGVRTLTRGYWIGPKIEAKIWILRKTSR